MAFLTALVVLTTNFLSFLSFLGILETIFLNGDVFQPKGFKRLAEKIAAWIPINNSFSIFGGIVWNQTSEKLVLAATVIKKDTYFFAQSPNLGLAKIETGALFSPVEVKSLKFVATLYVLGSYN